MTHGILAVAIAGTIAAVSLSAASQQTPATASPPRALSPSAAAPIDLTGYWVSIVNEDWRWRMVTPPKGDVASVPLNPEGVKVANAWDPATDGSCLAYGAAGVMRLPTRLHITWENESTLKIETDAGQQTRRFFFDKAKRPAGRPTLQGVSVAEWERPAAGRGAPPPVGGTLKATTTNLRAGWLRRNGVPYSAGATVTEYMDRFAAPNGDEWLVVTTIVSDPTYLNQDFVTSTHFKREPNATKWAPTPCVAAR